MALRILSADTALVPQTQESLRSRASREPGYTQLVELNERWEDPHLGMGKESLFNWEDQRQLQAEIDFVNQAHSLVDQLAVKVAPVLLRIVLTVERYIPKPADRRTFLAEHLAMDARRISDLCRVAESYGLLHPRCREDGEAEICLYGWSAALRLAHFRNSDTRRLIWEEACNGAPTASYRAVVRAISYFRKPKPKIISEAPQPPGKITSTLQETQVVFTSLTKAAQRLLTRNDCASALQELKILRRKFRTLEKALNEQMEAFSSADLEEATGPAASET